MRFSTFACLFGEADSFLELAHEPRVVDEGVGHNGAKNTKIPSEIQTSGHHT